MSGGARRALAVVAAAGPVLLIVLTLVLGAAWPGYDAIRDTQSELGAVDAPAGPLMNVAGFMGIGVSILAFAALYAATLRASWVTWLATGVLVVAGAGMITVGFFPCDAGCVDVTTTGRLHGVFSAPAAIGLPTAAMLSSWVFHHDGRLGVRWQATSMVLGVVSLALGPVIAAEILPTANGLLQRAAMWPVLVWMGLVALRIGVRSERDVVSV